MVAQEGQVLFCSTIHCYANSFLSTGSWGIQFAKHAGCFVATTCSEKNVEYVKSIGADQVIDYGKENWVEALQGQNFDAVYDCVGEVPCCL